MYSHVLHLKKIYLAIKLLMQKEMDDPDHEKNTVKTFIRIFKLLQGADTVNKRPAFALVHQLCDIAKSAPDGSMMKKRSFMPAGKSYWSSVLWRLLDTNSHAIFTTTLPGVCK
jgi:hypothetical protein